MYKFCIRLSVLRAFCRGFVYLIVLINIRQGAQIKHLKFQTM